MPIKVSILSLLFICLFSFTVQSQSAKKMSGVWERVAKKGNDPCAIDQRIELQLDGAAIIHYGQRFEECKETNTNFSTWEIGKKEGERNGKTKKFQVLTLKSDNDTVYFIIEEFKGDIMKVSVEIMDYDTTTLKSMIFRKK